MAGLGQEFEERKIANETPKEAKFTTKHGSQGVTNPVFASYTQRNPDLQKNYEANWKGKGVSQAEFGAMHYAKHGKAEGRQLEGPSGGSGESGGGGGGGGGGSSGLLSAAPIQSRPVSTEYESPSYEGPAMPSTTWQEYNPTPVGIDVLEPLLSEVVLEGPRSEVVENRIASLVNTNSPLFRAAAGQAMRQAASRGLSNSSMAQEAVMDAVIKVAAPIAMADAETFAKQRMLNQGLQNEFRAANNAAYFEQMGQRLNGAIQETLAHVAGGYALTQTKINDITKRYVADLSADTQRFSAMLSADTQRYVADMQFQLGMEGVRVEAAEVIASVNDNPAAAVATWNTIFGDNMNPADFYNTYVSTYS